MDANGSSRLFLGMLLAAAGPTVAVQDSATRELSGLWEATRDFPAPVAGTLLLLAENGELAKATELLRRSSCSCVHSRTNGVSCSGSSASPASSQHEANNWPAWQLRSSQQLVRNAITSAYLTVSGDLQAAVAGTQTWKD